MTLAYGLNDSPVGLAAYLVEKYRAWSDCDGDVEKSFTKDELLSMIMVYWAGGLLQSGTIGPSFGFYYEGLNDPNLTYFKGDFYVSVV